MAEPVAGVDHFSDSSDEEQVEPDELYDEGADDADEAWVDRHYRKETTRQGKRQPPRSDAVLNCPCCFTTLCMDCQRHERYKNQWRAMFIVNCTIKTRVAVAAPPPPADKKTKKKGKEEEGGMKEEEGEEVLHPVVCTTCGAEVGVQDAEEVVHFFNVLAS